MVDCTAPIKKIKIEKLMNMSERITDKNSSNLQSELQLYVKLHLGVLQSLYEGKRSHGPPNTVSAQHLAQVVPPIQLRIEQARRMESNAISDACLQVIFTFK